MAFMRIHETEFMQRDVFDDDDACAELQAAPVATMSPKSSVAQSHQKGPRALIPGKLHF